MVIVFGYPGDGYVGAASYDRHHGRSGELSEDHDALLWNTAVAVTCLPEADSIQGNVMTRVSEVDYYSRVASSSPVDLCLSCTLQQGMCVSV